MTATEYQPKRLFTPEQANNMLPLVRRIVADIQCCYRNMADRMAVYQKSIDSCDDAVADPYRDEVVAMRDELDRQQQQLRDYIQELDDLGVELKQPGEGLIDFPSMRDGRIVLLCWKLGEAEVKYWHELEAGYQGRQPLDSHPADTTA